MSALHGVTVVALEQAVAAPFATRQLADLGARVIKIERAEGDFARGYDATVLGQSSYFAWLNRGKESITLDIKDSADLALINSMLAGADVFMHNLAPGAVDRLGLGADDLRAAHPRLITCCITGYGSTGPYRDRKAYDLLVQCEAGLLSVTGTEDEPAKTGISVADIAAGMYAYTGVLTALLERERTGFGTCLDISMLDALGEWMSQPYLFDRYGGSPPTRAGARHATIAPYGPYRCGDSGAIFLAVQNDREWLALCRTLLGDATLATDDRFITNSNRVARNAEITTLIEAVTADRTTDDVAATLDGCGVAYARLRSVREFSQHPQLRNRGRWLTVETPGGPIEALAPPVTVAGQAPLSRPVPALGQHSAALRAEFGV